MKLQTLKRFAAAGLAIAMAAGLTAGWAIKYLEEVAIKSRKMQ